ncbi:MAG: glycine cleavage system aminomethyltransferase GcvT, partial [Kiritimatiellae bacterium]|nr:glycine cleavage system aminomethyltransferase GcvT [Kiritimatiellia bacterium]
MQTPLYASHVALGARMGPFGGWDMPIQYAGILVEHAHTRKQCSMFDTCHMGEFELSGPTAGADLERLLTQRVASIREGQCRYGYLLRDDGGVLDDLTCYRFGPERFMLCVNAGTLAGDADWVRAHLSSSTVFRDLSPETAKLDIQGPTARRAMEQALNTALPELGYFRFMETRLAGTDCLLSRTGYTGEWGYEVYFPASEAVRFWDLFIAGGEIKPAGLGARDTLRLEMGYPLYGHELSVERTPVAATRGQFVDMEKEFIGKAAVARDLAQGVPRYLVGLRLETKRAARAHDHVLQGGQAVGEITSGSLAPSLGVAVAMAYVD